MQSRRLGRVEHGHGTATRCQHLAIGKADPLASVLIEELVAHSPVGLLVLAPVGVNLPGDLRGQLIGNAFHETPRVTSDGSYRHSTSATRSAVAAGAALLAGQSEVDRYGRCANADA